ncbi:PQQ-binding-like beta-propeller repeat protein [Actinoplanes sp. L3-i22]|uniref:outer membrane protein assembly factor BamB family protein n=1 Tax=Actinoplanes sp. L3-i22 TaxID=2836373 RepID=UPI001C7436A5|nr:PQQ-binding-like beta-propeller repeat protein [Actinoplanes sp. L3-i22]BCY14698.1 hypothetical protein L3i22_097860 [Actinoplanes sp. L3-i22]
MAIIELGDVSAPDFVEEPAPAPPLRRIGLRRPVAAVLAVLAAVALTGSGRPAPPSFAESWSAEIGLDSWPYPFAGIVLVNQGTPENQESVAYDLGTGQVRWRLHDKELPSWLNPDPDSNQLYAPAKIRTVEVDGGTTYFGTDTRALDAGTGTELWRRSGDELAATAGEVLLGDRDDRARITGLHLVRATDGTALWDRPIDPADNVVVSEDPADTTRIVLATAAGRLTTLRYTDGAVLATRQVDRPHTQLTWGPQLLGGRFFDVRHDGAVTTLVAYGTDSLTDLWRFTTTGDVYVQNCGPVLCVNDTHLTTALDPATGTRLWQLPSGDATPLTNGRLLIADSRQIATEQAVVDARTGRAVRTAPPHSRILAVDGDRLLELRDTTTAPYRVTIARWDPDTGRRTLLGAVLGRSDTCQLSGHRMLCTGAGRLSVTDVG